jgi:hypothetical protein
LRIFLRTFRYIGLGKNQIGTVPFIDGINRPVFLDANGRQFVLDDDGQPVFGTRVYIDEPLILDMSNR